MTNSLKSPALIILLSLSLIIVSYFTWNYLDIKNQELKIKLNQEKLESDKIKLNQELTEMKTYKDTVVRFTDTIVSVSTKWRDGKMDYQVSLPISEKFFQVMTNKSNNFSASLTIELIDKDGFKIDSIYMPLNSVTNIVDENNRIVEKRKNGGFNISSGSYMMIDGIRVLNNIQ